MKILITGATGFVGRAIIEEISAKNTREIYCIGNKNTYEHEKLPNLYKADICDPDAFKNLKKTGDFDVVIHSAGLAHQFRTVNEDRFFQVNAGGTRNILEFAYEKSAKHFILISSIAVYGAENALSGDKNIQEIIDEEKICQPKSVYAKSKLKAEEIAIDFCREKSMCLTILRLATVIGEEDRGNVFRLIRAIDKRRFIMIGRGENYKTLIYKADVGCAVREILEKKDLSVKTAEIFNVGAEPVKMKSIVGQISKVLGRKTNFYLPQSLFEKPLNIFLRIIPLSELKKIRDTLAKWTSNEIFSSEKIKRQYQFSETPVSEAIEREVTFYKNQKC